MNRQNTMSELFIKSSSVHLNFAGHGQQFKRIYSKIGIGFIRLNQKNLFIILFIFSNPILAETQFFYGFRPQISITKNISDRWDWNVFTSDNTNLTDKTYGKTHFPENIQYYFQTGPIYKYSPDLNFVFLGYIYQRTNPVSNDFVNENRLFQQVIYGADSMFGRLTHRGRFEERFIQNRVTGQTPFSTRLRYQVALLVPLQGSELESGEFYFNVYNEFYFSLTGARNALYSENWSYAGIGYKTVQYGLGLSDACLSRRPNRMNDPEGQASDRPPGRKPR